MSAIQMQFSADEAIVLMRVLAVAKRKATSMDERDDLEILHGRIYDQMYRSQRESPSVAFGDSVRTRGVEIHPFSHTDRTQARREPVTSQSWREWHPSLSAAA